MNNLERGENVRIFGLGKLSICWNLNKQCAHCYKGEYMPSCFDELVKDMEVNIDTYALADDSELEEGAWYLKRKVFEEMTRLYNKLPKTSHTSME